MSMHHTTIYILIYYHFLHSQSARQIQIHQMYNGILNIFVYVMLPAIANFEVNNSLSAKDYL